MAIKVTDEYIRLVNLYDEYTQRRKDELEGFRSKVEECDQKIADLKYMLDNVNVSSEKEYIKASNELKEEEDRRKYYEALLESSEKAVCMTTEEEAELRKALKAEVRRLCEESEEVIFKALTPVLGKVEDYITKIKVLEILYDNANSNVFTKTVHGSLTVLPPLVADLSIIGLGSYEKIAKANKKTRYFTEGSIILDAENKKVRRLTKRVVKPIVTKGINITR